MQALQITLPTPMLIPDGPKLVVLVGCGGTGSHIAQALARIASHLQAQGQPLTLVFVDGDVVEAKNVGRQLFSPAELGRNKAQTLAARFNAALGLQITAVPQMATAMRLNDLAADHHRSWRLLIGAVDGASGRKAIDEALQKCYHGWLDCGNHESSGQVCFGTERGLFDSKAAFRLPGVCASLPAPSRLYPELLVEARKLPRLDCAAAQEDNAQSLMVNQMMAAIAGEYLYNLLVRRRLETCATTVDLASLTMRTIPITRSAIASALGVTETPAATPRRKKAA